MLIRSHQVLPSSALTMAASLALLSSTLSRKWVRPPEMLSMAVLAPAESAPRPMVDQSRPQEPARRSTDACVSPSTR